MDFNKEVFKEKFKNRLDEKYALDVKDATPQELYLTLSSIVRSSYSRYWRKTWKKYMEDGKKQIYYFSIEFLPGRLLMSNLLNMGWLETVREALKDLDIDLDEIAEAEKDMAIKVMMFLCLKIQALRKLLWEMQLKISKKRLIL